MYGVFQGNQDQQNKINPIDQEFERVEVTEDRRYTLENRLLLL
jgi:hypothetical protein